jgi:hypothetical protein
MVIGETRYIAGDRPKAIRGVMTSHGADELMLQRYVAAPTETHHGGTETTERRKKMTEHGKATQPERLIIRNASSSYSTDRVRCSRNPLKFLPLDSVNFVPPWCT